MSKLSIETTYKGFNDDDGGVLFEITNDSDGCGLVHIEFPDGDLNNEECELLITAIRAKIEDNRKYLS